MWRTLRNLDKARDRMYHKSMQKLTHAKKVDGSISGRKLVKTKSGHYVRQEANEHYYGVENEWRDRRKHKDMFDFYKHTAKKASLVPDSVGSEYSQNRKHFVPRADPMDSLKRDPDFVGVGDPATNQLIMETARNFYGVLLPGVTISAVRLGISNKRPRLTILYHGKKNEFNQLNKSSKMFRTKLVKTAGKEYRNIPIHFYLADKQQSVKETPPLTAEHERAFEAMMKISLTERDQKREATLAYKAANPNKTDLGSDYFEYRRYF